MACTVLARAQPASTPTDAGLLPHVRRKRDCKARLQVVDRVPQLFQDHNAAAADQVDAVGARL